MASPSPDIKQEPSGENHDMGTVPPFQLEPVDADLPEQNGGNQAQQNNNSPAEQNGGNQAQQNNNSPAEQNGGNQAQQNNNSPAEQNGGNQAQQNGNSPNGQNNSDGSDQASGSTDRNNKQKSRLSDEDIRAAIQDRLRNKRPKAKTRNGITKTGGQDRAAERREHKLAERQANSNSSPPLQQGARTSETSLAQQRLQMPSPSPSPSTSDIDVDTDDESDSDIRQLTGFHTPAANMTTLGALKTGNKPRFLNEYRAGNRVKYRIQSIKSPGFNTEGAILLTDTKWRTAQLPKSWSEIIEIGGKVIGVAAAGNEEDHSTFLARLDPFNDKRFQYRQTIYILIRLPNNNLAILDRSWIRKYYDPSDDSQEMLFKEKHPHGCWYQYKTKDDPEPRWRQNKNAFVDSIIFTLAYAFEKKYHKVAYAGQNFIVENRKSRSPTPYADEILRFRESTIPPDEETPWLGVVQSVESPEAGSDAGTGSRSENSSQPRRTSPRQPSTRHSIPPRVGRNGSPRPKNAALFNKIRQSQKPLGSTPRPTVIAR